MTSTKKTGKGKLLLIITGVIVLMGLTMAVYKVKKLHYDIWLSDYIFNSPTGFIENEVTDIIFFKVDHWEPGDNENTVNEWMSRYRQLADRHVDSDGRKLQHTFFYPLEQFRGYQVDSLVRLCRDGYGDVEIHLHHMNDTYESLKAEFLAGIDSLQAHGAIISTDNKTHFGFIHGNWALDNSPIIEGRNLCGVNNEIELLLELGCYGDFTFPALQTTAQPRWVNKIGYAVDDPVLPKSYDNIVQSQVGLTTDNNQLMIFSGPLMINWCDWRFGTHPTVDNADLYGEMYPDSNRFQIWLKANIHVLGNSQWVFVRAFTHGGSVRHDAVEANLGEAMDEMMNQVESHYKSNPKYRLHYMTAREVYNVVKAAESGMTGDANDYRDFIIKPYLYPVNQGGGISDEKK